MSMGDSCTAQRALSFFGSVTASVVRCRIHSSAYTSVPRLERSDVFLTLRASLVHDERLDGSAVTDADNRHEGEHVTVGAAGESRANGVKSDTVLCVPDGIHELFRATSMTSPCPLRMFRTRRSASHHHHHRDDAEDKIDDNGRGSNKGNNDTDNDNNSCNDYRAGRVHHRCEDSTDELAGKKALTFVTPGGSAIDKEWNDDEMVRLDACDPRACLHAPPASDGSCTAAHTVSGVPSGTNDFWYRHGGQFMHRLYLPVLLTCPSSPQTTRSAVIRCSTEAEGHASECTARPPRRTTNTTAENRDTHDEEKEKEIVEEGQHAQQPVLLRLCVVLSRPSSTRALTTVKDVVLSPSLHTLVMTDMCAITEMHVDAAAWRAWLHDADEGVVSLPQRRTFQTESDSSRSCTHVIAPHTPRSIRYDHCAVHAVPHTLRDGTATAATAPMPSTDMAHHVDVDEDDDVALTVHVMLRVVDLSAPVRAACGADEELRRLLGGGNRRGGESALHTGLISAGWDKGGEAVPLGPNTMGGICATKSTMFDVPARATITSRVQHAHAPPYACMPRSELYRHYTMFYHTYWGGGATTTWPQGRRHVYHRELRRALECGSNTTAAPATEERCTGVVFMSHRNTDSDGDSGTKSDHLTHAALEHCETRCTLPHHDGASSARVQNGAQVRYTDADPAYLSREGILRDIRLEGAVLIGETAMAPLLCTLAHCPHVRHMYLDGNQLGDWTCGRLCALLSRHSYLQSISLRNNSIHESGAMQLLRLARRCHTLTRVCLESNPCSAAVRGRVDAACARNRAALSGEGATRAPLCWSSLPDITPLHCYMASARSTTSSSPSSTAGTVILTRDDSDPVKTANTMRSAALTSMHAVRRACRVWAILTATPVGDVDVWTRNSTTGEMDRLSDDCTREAREAAAAVARAESASTIPPLCQAALLNEVMRAVKTALAGGGGGGERLSTNSSARLALSVFADLCETRQALRERLYTHVTMAAAVRARAAPTDVLLRVSGATASAAARLARERAPRRAADDSSCTDDDRAEDEMTELHMLAAMVSPQSYVDATEKEEYCPAEAERSRDAHENSKTKEEEDEAAAAVCRRDTDDATQASLPTPSGADANADADAERSAPQQSAAAPAEAWLTQVDRVASTRLAQAMERHYRVSFLRLVVITMTHMACPDSWYERAQPQLRELARVQQQCFDLVTEDYVRAIWAFVAATQACCDMSSGRGGGFDREDKEALLMALTFGARTALSMVPESIADHCTTAMNPS